MYTINDSFIGYSENFRHESFSGSDTVDLFKTNLKTKPIDWYYRTAKISYHRNSLGHRSKEISEIDLDNYILSVGCSLTEGIGIEYDKTYTHVLSNMMGCDYYNMGVGGHSIQTVLHNTIVWFNKIKKKPKLLVIQQPEPCRFPILKGSELLPGSVNYKDKNIVEFAVVGDQVNYWNTIHYLAMMQLNSFDIPIIEIMPYGYDKTGNNISFELIDTGRDNHPGIESNKKIATSIYDNLKEKGLL